MRPLRQNMPALLGLAAALLAFVAAALLFYRQVVTTPWQRLGRWLAPQVGPAESVLLASCDREDWARHFAPAPVLCGPPWPDPAHFNSLWLVQESDRPSPPASQFAARFETRRAWTLGPLRVERLERAGRQVFDAVASIRQAKVARLRKNRTVETCSSWSKGRFDCPGDFWRDIGPDNGHFDGVDVRGVWVHPIEGKVTRIEWPAVELGRRLQIFAGLADESRSKRVPFVSWPVALRVVIDGRHVQTRWLWPWQGLTTTTLSLVRLPVGPHALRLETIVFNDYFANLFVAAEGLK